MIISAPNGIKIKEWVKWRCSSSVSRGFDSEPKNTSRSGANAAIKPIKEAVLKVSLSENN